ncbi:MAG TPA: chloride channel protein [Acidobacteriaceae bacterium]|nr:chloride channel protein [Acidobacteriaceae bacterium]
MSDFSVPEAVEQLELAAEDKGQFGIALEPQVVKICCYALLVGLIGGLVAQGLLELIYLFTNLFFYGRFSFSITYPAHNHLHFWVVLIPPIGGLVVGLLIYFFEPTLKGHGIPEAMEAVLFGHSRMRPRVAILKPLATALAIGTGGPFGAEGPIIQTGGALGSLLGQALGLSPYYRRVLLASGAAAGMAATFTAPLAGILVAVELLLFELRAKSFIPVAMASAVATGVRVYFVGWAPLFPTPEFQITGTSELWLFAVLGILMGMVGIVMIRTLSWLEDFFDHLPFKYAAIWSPAIGAAILGVIGFFCPQVFGTSYDTIRDMLNDRLTVGSLLGIGFAKFWALVISLGSGTTGGVFAPSLVVGGGLGAAFAVGCKHIFPHLVSDPALYSLVAMAGVFGCIARAPFTSIVFLLELSHNPNSMLPLIVCVMIADGVVRLFSRDSIMTVKLVKRGLIVLQDYWVPVLMRARIDQVMRSEFTALEGDEELRSVILKLPPNHLDCVPIVDRDGSLIGIVEAHDLLRIEQPDHHFTMKELAHQDYVLAFPGETVDRVQRKMMLKNVENVVVVKSIQDLRPVGIVRANDILQLRRWLLVEETGNLRRTAHDKPAETLSVKPE